MILEKMKGGRKMVGVRSEMQTDLYLLSIFTHVYFKLWTLVTNQNNAK